MEFLEDESGVATTAWGVHATSTTLGPPGGVTRWDIHDALNWTHEQTYMETVEGPAALLVETGQSTSGDDEDVETFGISDDGRTGFLANYGAGSLQLLSALDSTMKEIFREPLPDEAENYLDGTR